MDPSTGEIPRQRLAAETPTVVLRHGIVYEGTGSTWTAKHRASIPARDLG
jgi:hypothetical protein